MTTALVRTSGNGFELTLTVGWEDVKKVYEQVVDLVVAESEKEGFRKGKAPRDLVLKDLDKGKIYGEVINQLLPKAYANALEEHKLKPIISPKVQIVSADEEKDWVFRAVACEKPNVDLRNALEQVKSLNAKAKIWKPGEEEKKETVEDKSKKINEIISKILEICVVELAPSLLEQETQRLMSQLVNDVRAAGLTMEQYLSSSGKTSEQLNAHYAQEAKNNLSLEFILEEIAIKEKISVSQQEVQAVIEKESDPKVKENLTAQSYMLTSILKREKVLTYLANL